MRRLRRAPELGDAAPPDPWRPDRSSAWPKHNISTGWASWPTSFAKPGENRSREVFRPNPVASMFASAIRFVMLSWRKHRRLRKKRVHSPERIEPRACHDVLCWARRVVRGNPSINAPGDRVEIKASGSSGVSAVLAEEENTSSSPLAGDGKRILSMKTPSNGYRARSSRKRRSVFARATGLLGQTNLKVSFTSAPFPPIRPNRGYVPRAS